MSAIVNSSHLVISLFALWFLYFYCWREHRIDAYRQRLFAIRDGLFDFAASGAIGFDDPAYTTLRSVSNGLIRFGHRLTFSRVLIVACLSDVSSNRMERWMEDVKKRPPEVRDRLLKAHGEIARASLLHVLAWSPLAWVCILVGIVIAVLRIPTKIRVKSPKDISAVLEQEALDQSSMIDEESCLATI